MSTHEVSLFNSSASTVEGITHNGLELDGIDEEVIIARLNELRLWQESQRKNLVEHQMDEQKMLELEKQKLYAMFGISTDDTSYLNAGVGSSNSSLVIQTHQNDVYEAPKTPINDYRPLIDENALELNSPSINQLQKIIENMANRSPRHTEYPDTSNIPKRPYLKRGEGLKNRFKISPDAFRLDKLPKYKYAQRMQKHAQTQMSRKQRHQEITTNDTKVSTATKREDIPSERRQQYNKNDVYNETNSGKVKELTTKRPSPRTLQLKLKPNPIKQSKLKASSNDVNKFIQQNHDVLQSDKVVQAKNIFKTLSPATKLLLDTPTRERVKLQQDEINDLKQFVQLEKDLNKNSEMDKGRNDDNLVLKFKVGLNVSPKNFIAKQRFGNIEEVDEEDDEHFHHSISSDSSMGDESKHVRFHSKAIAFEKPNQRNDVPIYDVPKTSSPYEKSTDSFVKFKEKLFDRRLKQKFMNRLSVAKDFEISDLNSNKGANDDDDEGTFASSIYMNETDGDNAKAKIQERLMSLEQEIQSFREQNNELTKLIREYEMIRMTFEEEQRVVKERTENERINFEMYMHDQRLKMLDDKTKWEKKTKESRTITQTEKDELARLREKCSSHEVELSAREQKHVAAQARIRAQLRNAEKDLKETRFEVENLQRENKKLEAENMRMRRQSNSKILNEINKSISKLAHTNEYDNQHENEKDGVNEKSVRYGVKKCSNKNAHKTVVAKVTSHREPKENQMRSKSVPNLQSENTDKYSYELCSSPNPSECDNSESSSHDGNAINKSSYFPSKAPNKEHFNGIEDDAKGGSNQCDESDTSTSMKRIIDNPDGSKDIWYPNGNLKKVSADGMSIRMLYFNKDIKETDIKEGTVKYYYAESNTWQTTYLDGLEIFEYPDGQTEHRYKDGKIEIYFPNGTVRIISPARELQEGIKEEWKYPDGSNAIQMTNGERMLMLSNGQREVHANGHKRREYPDGTVKIVYPDGSQETRYSNGRVRLKNKDGKLIMDSETISI